MTVLAAPKIVSQSAWLAARRRHLAREKELTRLRDELLAERRRLPWVRIEKDYVFAGPEGRVSLAALFGGRSQLIVYHFMLGPDWDEGCRACSFLADHFDGPRQHLEHHDVTLAAVSRAPLARIDAFKRRMGWRFPWVSSLGNDFNFDFHVSISDADRARGRTFYNYRLGPIPPGADDELPGVSVFARDAAGDVFHTYSSYARGLDVLIGAHHFLDLTPGGRNERGTMDWVRHHDRYGREE